MKSQEIFNRVLTHLRKQGHASFGSAGDNGETCLYRGDNGDMCAVGCLITDEAYDPAFEGDDISEQRVLNAVETSIGRITKRQGELLMRLQRAHDFHLDRGMGVWEGQMVCIAQNFNLKYTPPA
ncbi:hypothetical protein [Castellaniella sp.]|uniref:hypothetical protein n=1 Tax=Castellaniella sp. TaxID=1955812 RepID=UPI002AFEE168|nr:hypothetical protein [Castellaniella sp.]